MNSLSRELDLQSVALEVARNEVGMKLPMKELLPTLGLSEQQFLAISKDRLFVRQVRAFKKELEDTGMSFQMKARIQAEELLKKQWAVIHDPMTPPQVAVKAIENTVRWAGLDAKTVDASAQKGPGFNITINVPSAPALQEKAVVLDQIEDQSE